MRLLFALVVAACGTDTVGPRETLFGTDAPPAGLSVRVVAPNGGEAFYQTDSVTVSWIPHDDAGGAITCEVEVIDASGATTIAIAAAVAATSDVESSATWMPASVATGEYRIAVTCTDASGRSATDESNAVFAIAPPPRDISFAGELQPMFTAGCTDNPCHDATAPQQGLRLTAGSSYTELVGVTSQQCGSLQLVMPGSPSTSYLVHKLAGSNPGGCFVGLPMPKLDARLTADQIQAVRDWIANGAPNN